MFCHCKVGFFLVRACNKGAQTLCPRCQKPACAEHLRLTNFQNKQMQLCVTCHRELTRNYSDTTDYSDTRSSSSSSSSSSSRSDSFSGKGGTFGGAGASGTWDPADTAAAAAVASSTTTTTDTVFSAQELAVFDETSDFDKGSGGGGSSYDS